MSGFAALIIQLEVKQLSELGEWREYMDETDRLRGLAHCDVINELLSRRPMLLQRLNECIPRNAVERHQLTHGHPLRFGCCKGTDTDPVPSAPVMWPLSSTVTYTRVQFVDGNRTEDGADS
jgi:hypothetical protein